MLLTERLSALYYNNRCIIIGSRKYSKKRLYVEKQLSMKNSSQNNKTGLTILKKLKLWKKIKNHFISHFLIIS
jgi:hypothetical protein